MGNEPSQKKSSIQSTVVYTVEEAVTLKKFNKLTVIGRGGFGRVLLQRT